MTDFRKLAGLGELGTGPDWDCYVCWVVNLDLRTRCRNCGNERRDDTTGHGGEVRVFECAPLEFDPSGKSEEK